MSRSIGLFRCSDELTAIVVGEPTTVGLTELAVGVSK